GHAAAERDPARETPRDAAGAERTELGGERALPAVLEAMDRSRDRAAIDRRGVEAAATDGIAHLTAREAEPSARRIAAGAARSQEDLEYRAHSAGSKESSSPACVPVWAAVPAGSSMDSRAPR